jgi:uncharacterized protein (DUF1501 family)
MVDLSRRTFLQTTAALALPTVASAAPAGDVNCIFLTLVGGPSQLDTWDPKPDAPAEVRGPFRPIATRIPGIRFTELFPRMAAAADQFAVVRSVHHTAAPVHEAGLQLMQTGRLADPGSVVPHFGARLSAAKGGRGSVPANVLLPGPLGHTGLTIDRGQSAGSLGEDHNPRPIRLDITADPERERYGRTPFGDDCLRAARLVERGTRFVTVNMFPTVYDTVSWDCHAAGGSLATTLDDYRTVGPMFDAAFTALLADLRSRGLLDSTLVVATGEFGRTPHMNRAGGRDHWAGVWTMLLAGAGVRGGEVIGSSDRLGGEPADRPMSAEAVGEMIRDRLGLA